MDFNELIKILQTIENVIVTPSEPDIKIQNTLPNYFVYIDTNEIDYIEEIDSPIDGKKCYTIVFDDEQLIIITPNDFVFKFEPIREDDDLEELPDIEENEEADEPRFISVTEFEANITEYAKNKSTYNDEELLMLYLFFGQAIECAIESGLNFEKWHEELKKIVKGTPIEQLIKEWEDSETFDNT